MLLLFLAMNFKNALEAIKEYLFDWILVVILAVLAGVSITIHPTHRYITQLEMDNYTYPYKDHETVPPWTVPVIALAPAIATFLIFKLIKKIDGQTLNKLFLGLLGSFLITVIITNAFKNFAGRPRPHFFDRCFPDGTEIIINKNNYNINMYNNNTIYYSAGIPVCDIKDAWRSFPSGHSSETMAGLMFLSLFLLNQITIWGRLWEAVMVIGPLFAGGIIAISRVHDYYHHWQDVLFGYLLGSFCAILVYFYYFPLQLQEISGKLKQLSSRSRSNSQHVALDENNGTEMQNV